MSDLQNVKKIYFVGIKGVGMASLAVIAKEAGLEIRGSDIDQSFITDIELSGIHIDTQFDPKFLDEFMGSTSLEEMLVITTAAHGGFENPQVKYAQSLKLNILSHGQAVGAFMEGSLLNREFVGISVAGSHGKTSTSAMLAVTLSKLNRDPSYTIGTSEIFPIGFGGHYGTGDYFIAEADEYFSELSTDRKPKFLYQHPTYAIINNLDFDHPDVYQNFDAVKKAFVQFANTESIKTVFVSTDEKLQEIVPLIKKEVVMFGEHETADYRLENFEERGLEVTFDVYKGEIPFGKFTLSVPGKHNALNALGVIALLLEIGVHPDDLIPAIKEFKGTKRRLEKIGQTQSGIEVYDDYAHHPQEIQTTLHALQAAYPDHKIITIFQPHTYSRTKSLLEEFGSAFTVPQQTIILPIFPSAREHFSDQEKEEIDQKLRNTLAHATFLETPDSVIEYVGAHSSPDSLIVTMGAGDVYKIGKKLTV